MGSKAVTLALLAVACGADTSALDAKVTAQQQQIEAQQQQIDGLGKMVAALMASSTATKTPHLVAIGTGDDLGWSLGGTLAYNDKAGGFVDYRNPCEIGFALPDCKGTAGLVQTAPDQDMPTWRCIGPNGTALKATMLTMRFDTVSWLVMDVWKGGPPTCSNTQWSTPQTAYRGFVDTGVPLTVYPDETTLAIELR